MRKKILVSQNKFNTILGDKDSEAVSVHLLESASEKLSELLCLWE